MTRALSDLSHAGLLSKSGSTRNATYSRINNSLVKTNSSPNSLKMRKILNGLQEDKVFSELDLRLNLKKYLSSKAYQSFNYAFTEMLNNAIDHSRSKYVNIEVSLNNGAQFTIRDEGIGVFYNVQKTFKLENEFQGLEHLLKGKQSTDPARHSGQGIFFTSRIADLFTITSHKIKVSIDNKADDTFVADHRSLRGTSVYFSINSKSRKILRELFEEYSNDAFEFTKGEMRIKLSANNSHLSRSEAKRLTWGLEKYQKLVFDFKGVKEIGQAFADEIFRVFQAKYPRIQLEAVHMNPAVEFMVKRVAT